MATLLADTGLKPMSRQSMCNRLSERSTDFLQKVLQFLLDRELRSSLGPTVRDSLPFKRVILEDSTTLPMGLGNRANYPGAGGNGRSAGAKLRMVIDLLSSKVLAISRHSGANPDQSLCDHVLESCTAGDLIVRDMGFFCLGSLKRLSDKGVRWLTRLPASTSARTLDGTSLYDLLRSSKSQVIDCEIVIGGSRNSKPITARLVAKRVPKEIAERNRRERNRKSTSMGKTPSAQSNERAGWTIMVTDVPASEVAAADLLSLYSQRWMVEIVFRAIKGTAHIDQALRLKRRKVHQDAIILSIAIVAVLELAEFTFRKSKIPKNAKRQFSVEKVCRVLGHYLLSLTGPIKKWPPFQPDERSITSRKRADRLTLYEKAIYALS